MTATAAPSEAAAPAPRSHRRRLRVIAVAVALLATGCLDITSHSRLNDERRARGLQELPRHGALDTLAQAHAQRMANECRIYHSSTANWMQPGYRTAAENVGVGNTVEIVHQALMASDSHRTNILNGSFRTVGIGAVERPECGFNKVFIVQLFNG